MHAQTLFKRFTITLLALLSLGVISLSAVIPAAAQDTAPRTAGPEGEVTATATVVAPTIVVTSTVVVTTTATMVPADSVNASTKLFLPLLLKQAIGSVSTASGWVQDAHDAQRTGYISEEPLEPWTLLWKWNGPDANGGTSKHFYDANREARTVMGGGKIYVPAGAQGLYALNVQTGAILWRVTATTFKATPAYDPATGFVYAGGTDGRLYKINASTGSVASTYNAGSPLNKPMLLVNSSAYVVTASGELHKVNTQSMARTWRYSAGSAATTPPSYSAKRAAVVFATADLYVHAVKDSDGTRKWRVKPTVHTQGDPYTYDGYWPVIAEQHGIVFVRLNLGMDGLWSGPGTGHMFPATNAQIRSYLVANPEWQNLFALSLDDGSTKFIPAVGFGGVELGIQESTGIVPVLEVGPVPVVRILPDGKEVVYTFWRAGQFAPEPTPSDGRWDSHIGEMVLDNQTVSGLVAGDLRFVQMANAYDEITDEQCPLSMAGATLFHAHWGASESVKIVDRSASRGLVHSSPILTTAHPTVIRRQQQCSDFDPSNNWTSCGLTLYQDGRYWNGPGWWTYWNVQDPNATINNGNRSGILPRYTYVSNGYIVVEGNGGELLVFRHSGQPEE